MLFSVKSLTFWRIFFGTQSAKKWEISSHLKNLSWNNWLWYFEINCLISRNFCKNIVDERMLFCKRVRNSHIYHMYLFSVKWKQNYLGKECIAMKKLKVRWKSHKLLNCPAHWFGKTRNSCNFFFVKSIYRKVL